MGNLFKTFKCFFTKRQVNGVLKKGMMLLVSCLCLIGLSGCGWFSSKEQTTQRTTTEETIASAEDIETFSEETTEGFISESQLSQAKEAQIDETTKSFLKDFARKWSNFTDVYKRNQAVREYMTERCIQDNSIDVDPHVQIKTTGKLHQMTQDVDNPDQYLLFGEEHANEVTRFVLLQVKVVEQKIDAIKVYYVRSAY
ncbi:EF0163 family protein [Enterococcus sp. 5B3_DIV0040]|uniref:EF0163 family protein n=1 Tax=Enterococcus sp. 5B3_DIV0040 TaxID=1834182 RepID=UPI0020CEFF1D|nr:EF0163 family protein [Enterococcus sp. 5B3_DIV0040]